MAVRLHITTPPLGWSRGKVRMVVRDLKGMLSQEGVPNCQIRIEIVGQKVEKKEEKYLHLSCGQCLEEWYSATFVPCPTCGKKAHVEKVQPERVPIPPPDETPAAAASEPTPSKTARTTKIETKRKVGSRITAA